MYRIYCDDKTLHDVRDEEYQLITPKSLLNLIRQGVLSSAYSLLISCKRYKEIEISIESI